MTADDHLVGLRSPRSMYSLACFPLSVPSLTAASQDSARGVVRQPQGPSRKKTAPLPSCVPCRLPAAREMSEVHSAGGGTPRGPFTIRKPSISLISALPFA